MFTGHAYKNCEVVLGFEHERRRTTGAHAKVFVRKLQKNC
jgi:hypothetical protein